MVETWEDRARRTIEEWFVLKVEALEDISHTVAATTADIQLKLESYSGYIPWDGHCTLDSSIFPI